MKQIKPSSLEFAFSICFPVTLQSGPEERESVDLDLGFGGGVTKGLLAGAGFGASLKAFNFSRWARAAWAEREAFLKTNMTPGWGPKRER